MRSLILSLLCLSAAAHAQNEPVPTNNQIVPIEDFRETGKGVVVVNGKPFVKGTRISEDWIMWQEDGTASFVSGNYTGAQTEMRISAVGAAQQDEIWYRNFPLMLDRRGDLWAIDDSVEQEYRSKLAYWATGAGLMQGGVKLALPIGFAAAVVQAALVNPNLNILYTGTVTALAAYVLRAVMDLRKSHRQLGRGFNFFTHQIARNVKLVRNIHHTNGEHDIEIIYKNGDSRNQPSLASQIFAQPNAPKYQEPNCIAFLRKKEN